MKGLLLLGIFILLLILVCHQTGCTNEPSATRVLQQNGYTDIRMTGYQLWCCRDDLYSTGFIAKSPNGVEVKGCVCQDLDKAATIRFY